MIDWGSLHDAYGRADPVGPLLAGAAAGARGAWEDLWSRLCHQGTVYSASYAALPRLAQLAADWRHGVLNEPLFLATSIIASSDGPQAPAAVRGQHPEAAAVLREVAERAVTEAHDDTYFVYAVQALLATEGDSVWATRLEALANGELELSCSRCAEQLLVDLDASPSAARSWEDASLATTVVRPVEPTDLVGAEARVHRLALDAGRNDAVASLLRLFGVLACPRCDLESRMADALA